MLDKIKEGHDVVYAARKSRGIDSLFKRKTADVFYWIIKNLVWTLFPITLIFAWSLGVR
jgi:hypothetical protein